MKMTKKKILPELEQVVREYGTIHYTQATKLLLNKGVWGKDVPPTPELTVNNYLTTSRTKCCGSLMFTRVDKGTYQLAT